MERYDLYGFRGMDILQAIKYIEGSLGIIMGPRESSYRGVYYVSKGDGSAHVLEENDENGDWLRKYPEYQVTLTVKDIPDMDGTRDRLTSGVDDPVFLESRFYEPQPDDDDDDDTVHDFFVAELTCPACGNVSPADTRMFAWSDLRGGSEEILLSVGSELAIDPDRIRDNGYRSYRTVRTPSPGEPIHILRSWSCRFCDVLLNWMEIIVTDGIITSIEAVPFDREHLQRSHLVFEDAGVEAAALVGSTLLDFEQTHRGTDIVQFLFEHLPHDTPGDTRA
jgi:hypothetical protein